MKCCWLRHNIAIKKNALSTHLSARVRSAMTSLVCLFLFVTGLQVHLLPVLSQQAHYLEERATGNEQGNTGNEFYLAFMDNYLKPVFRNIPSLVINKSTLFITTSESSGAVTVIDSQLGTSTHMVRSGATVSTSIQRFKVQSTTDRSKGIRIKAEQTKLISLFALNEELHSVDGFTALPCTLFPSISTYKYIAVSVPRSTASDTTADSAFLIVACSNDTRVTVTPTQSVTHPSVSGRVLSAGESVEITLNERDTLYVQSREDLTGSKVQSTAPISFFSGHECGNVPENVTECDHLVEQIPPTATWGRQFLLAPTATRRGYDVIKMVASEENTVVTVSCTDSSTVSEMQNISLAGSGNYSDFRLSSDQYCSVDADKPILVVQFTAGKSADSAENGDPFMVLVPAITQYLDNTTFSTVHGLGLFFDNYMNVYSPVGQNEFDPSTIIMDGIPLATDGWVTIPCSDGSTCGHAAQVAIHEGMHSIWNSNPRSPLGVTVYGLSYLETYAYVGGLKLSLTDGPTITPPPQTSYIVLIGSSICLPCAIDPPHFVQGIAWSKDGRVIVETGRRAIAHNGALCISNTTRDDTGNYTCHVLDTFLSYQLSVLAGIIVEPPSCGPSASENTVMIGVGLEPSYVDSGTAVIQICCNVEGPPDSTTVSWLQDGSLIENGTRGYEVGEGYMRYTGPFAPGCIIFTCKATFASHVVTESSEVCIGSISPPTVVNITGELNVLEHTSASYYCSADGFPVPMKMWSAYRDMSDPLPSGAVDHGNGTLTIRNVTERDGTVQYCCDVSNDRGQLCNCIHINVLIPPQINAADSVPQIIISSSPSGAPGNVSIRIGQDFMIPERHNLKIFCETHRGNPKPTISWRFNNNVITSPNHTVQDDDSLLITGVRRGRDEGIFTCVATTPNVGQDSVNTIVTVTVPPQINSSNIVNSPGNCVDLTHQHQASQQVGSQLCLRAGPGTSLYLHCDVSEGVPSPDVKWLKDGQNLAQALDGYQYLVFATGILLIENLTLPIEASLMGKGSMEGNYTCVATNVAGMATASSYVVLFGNISAEIAKTEFVRQQSHLYHHLHKTISEHFPGVESGDEHLIFLTSGRILTYEDFDPGHLYDGSEESILPQTMENIFDMVDIVPNGGSIVFDPHEGKRLLETYTSLLKELQVTPSTLSLDEQRKIREYLLEQVHDPGLNKSLPRLSIYLLYKNSYYMTKIDVDNAIDFQRRKLLGWEFSEWYERNIHHLQSRISDVYMKWEMFAAKTEVEEKLGKLNLEDHSQEISDAHALLLANKRKSRFKDEKEYFLVRLYPDIWYKTLRNRVQESIQQMQFRLSQLKTEIQVLELTSQYLEEESRKREVLNALFPSQDPIYKLYCRLGEATLELEELVKYSEDLRYYCIVTGNPADCHIYWGLYEHISTHVVENYTELYWYVHTVEAALNHQEFSIPAIASTIQSIQAHANSIQSSINLALSESADRDDDETIDDRDFLTNFIFKPDTGTSTYDFDLPPSIVERLLWYINPESTRLLSKEMVQEYNATINHLNTVSTNVSAKLMKVSIHRRWFKPGIFGNSNLNLVTPGILVSPGNIHPSLDFREVVMNDSYRLPLYPSSLILATNIQLSVEVPFVFHSLPTLVRLSYDPHVSGGFGPFSFGPLFRASTGRMKFRVAVKDSKITITVPGTQLVGFVCDVVPQHPREVVDRGRRSSRSVEESRDMLTTGSQFDQWLFSKDREASSPDQLFHKQLKDSRNPSSSLPESRKAANNEHAEAAVESLATLITPTLPLESVHREFDVSVYSNVSISSSTWAWEDNSVKSTRERP